MAFFLSRAAPRTFRVAARATVRPQLPIQRPATPLFRRYLATEEQPRLRLGSVGME